MAGTNALAIMGGNVMTAGVGGYFSNEIAQTNRASNKDLAEIGQSTALQLADKNYNLQTTLQWNQLSAQQMMMNNQACYGMVMNTQNQIFGSMQMAQAQDFQMAYLKESGKQGRMNAQMGSQLGQQEMALMGKLSHLARVDMSKMAYQEDLDPTTDQYKDLGISTAAVDTSGGWNGEMTFSNALATSSLSEGSFLNDTYKGQWDTWKENSKPEHADENFQKYEGNTYKPA